MRKVTVTYTLTSSQEEKLQKIGKHLKHRDVDETMQYLMELGSVSDINNKLKYFENFYGLTEDKQKEG